MVRQKATQQKSSAVWLGAARGDSRAQLSHGPLPRSARPGVKAGAVYRLRQRKAVKVTGEGPVEVLPKARCPPRARGAFPFSDYINTSPAGSEPPRPRGAQLPGTHSLPLDWAGPGLDCRSSFTGSSGSSPALACDVDDVEEDKDEDEGDGLAALCASRA
jgi:hypothetical protein